MQDKTNTHPGQSGFVARKITFLPDDQAFRHTRFALHRSRKPAPRGFTLVELIAIMLLVSIIAFVALPRFDALDGFNAPAYRDQVRAVLQFARKAAVAQRRYVEVTTANNGMTLTISSTDPDGGFSVNNITRSLTIPGSSDNAIRAPKEGTIATAATPLIFDARGRPCDETGAALIQAASFTVSGLGITVEAESGYVH